MKNKLQYLIELEQSYHFTKILFKDKLIISYQLKKLRQNSIRPLLIILKSMFYILKKL